MNRSCSIVPDGIWYLGVNVGFESLILPLHLVANGVVSDIAPTCPIIVQGGAP
jgi:hypothetical protein